MKTILQHFKALPEPFRTQALENAEAAYLQMKEPNIWAAINSAIYLSETPQGKSYWDIVGSGRVAGKSWKKIHADIAAFREQKRVFIMEHSQMIQEVIKDYEQFINADFDFLELEQWFYDIKKIAH